MTDPVPAIVDVPIAVRIFTLRILMKMENEEIFSVEDEVRDLLQEMADLRYAIQSEEALQHYWLTTNDAQNRDGPKFEQWLDFEQVSRRSPIKAL